MSGGTVAILLAAGESRRMGQLKALLPWQGSTLLEHQITSLRDGGSDHLVVVLGHKWEALQPVVEACPGAEWTRNPHYAQGKTTSIKAGIQAALRYGPATFVLLNVDQPRSPDTIRALLQQHRPGPGSITIPAYQGKGGHPLLLDSSLLEELQAITEDTQGLRAVVRRHEESSRRVEMATPEVLWDLNTPEEYQAALKDL